MQLNTKDLMTLPELVKMLGVSRQTVYNWLDADTAPKHERLGGRYFFYRDSVKEFEKLRGKQ
jgi:excisionase family DNA binding protein